MEIVSTYKRFIKENVISRLDLAFIEVTEYIMKLYDDLLISQVTDRNSRANPLYYREEFLEKLNSFEHTDVLDNVVNFTVPSMSNFDFSGRLKMIENIMDGTAGVYIEVDGRQYERLFPNKKPPITEALDRSVPKNRMIYLVKYNYGLAKRWKNIFPKERMVRFPFSNTPPIRLFEETDDFVDQKLEGWLEESIDEATDKFEATIK